MLFGKNRTGKVVNGPLVIFKAVVYIQVNQQHLPTANVFLVKVAAEVAMAAEVAVVVVAATVAAAVAVGVAAAGVAVEASVEVAVEVAAEVGMEVAMQVAMEVLGQTFGSRWAGEKGASAAVEEEGSKGEAATTGGNALKTFRYNG